MFLFDQLLGILTFSLWQSHRITIGSISANKRKNVCLGTIELTEEYCFVFVGIHAFSGNDYISYFFKRRKEKMLHCTKIDVFH